MGAAGAQGNGMFSHLCVSDRRTDAVEKYTQEQILRFGVVRDYLHKKRHPGIQMSYLGELWPSELPGIFLMIFPDRESPSMGV